MRARFRGLNTRGGERFFQESTISPSPIVISRGYSGLLETPSVRNRFAWNPECNFKRFELIGAVLMNHWHNHRGDVVVRPSRLGPLSDLQHYRFIQRHMSILWNSAIKRLFVEFFPCRVNHFCFQTTITFK